MKRVQTGRNELNYQFVCLSPNSITPTFTETFPRGKSWTQIMKVADVHHLDMSKCLRQSS